MLANCHLGFNCVDLEKSLEFYQKYFGMKLKFSITYEELVCELERNGDFGEEYERYKEYAKKGIIWLAYLEWPDCPGYFLELFYGENRKQTKTPNSLDIGYTHFAVIVDDLQKLRESIVSLGGEQYIDYDIRMGLDETYQMWVHDPDGNRIEFMQYTDKSYQVVGKTKSEKK